MAYAQDWHVHPGWVPNRDPSRTTENEHLRAENPVRAVKHGVAYRGLTPKVSRKRIKQVPSAGRCRKSLIGFNELLGLSWQRNRLRAAVGNGFSSQKQDRQQQCYNGEHGRIADHPNHAKLHVPDNDSTQPGKS